jgi:hypothetical protein
MGLKAKIWASWTSKRHEGLEASANHTLAEKITDSLKISKTGLLGLRHFELAEEAIEQLQRKIESLDWTGRAL